MTNYSFKLIAGLGNPGKPYTNTYHNIGAETLCRITGNKKLKKPFSIWKKELFEYIKIENCIYIIPLTYMNETGKAIRAAARRFNIQPKDILIIHDDSDIMIGSYKLSYDRGSAGHNGIKSIISYLGTKNFWRLRIGIRRMNAIKASNFVLQKISPQDKELLEKVLSEIQVSYTKRHHKCCSTIRDSH